MSLNKAMTKPIAKLRAKKPKTMDDVYGDGSHHPCCPNCGMCKSCGDCKEFGCGRKKRSKK